MTLYIHFGIYKAGSSYIQYICANQREYLKDKGIYFPKSKEDPKMIKGLISKGNADGLEEALKNENKHKISSILKEWLKSANDLKTNAVLISAEAIVHQLAIESRTRLLLQIAKDIGYTGIKAMGFFRDLADHALSTYKHRAKSGKHPDYKYWIKTHYETPEMLKDLITSIEATRTTIGWTLRKFQKNSEFLKETFFKDWLQIPVPEFKTRPNVNESVTLSEIKVLNHLKNIYPGVLDYFVNDLKDLPRSQKAEDKPLSIYINAIFAEKLRYAQDILNNLNAFLIESESLFVGEPGLTASEATEPPIQLNDKQWSVLSHRLLFFKSLRGKFIRFKRFMGSYIKFVLL